MSRRKTIVHVYSGNEPFDFNDFVRGTLRLLNYTIDKNIDLKINIQGSNFESYVIVQNFVYNTILYTPKIYHMANTTNTLSIDLDTFILSSDPVIVITSNISLERERIYTKSYLAFDQLVRIKEYIYTTANTYVLNNLLYRPISDNLLYGYNIVYIDSEARQLTSRDIMSLVNQIRNNVNLNKDTIIFSNNLVFRTIVSSYINTPLSYLANDAIVDFTLGNNVSSEQDTMVNYVILLKANKIFRFTDSLTNKSDILGNLEYTSYPLYYGTYTIAGAPYPSSTPIPNTRPATLTDVYGSTSSLLNNPSGIIIDTSGNIFIADTLNHRICKLDTSNNFTTYAGSALGISGYTNGSALSARFNQPTSIAIDKTGNMYIADTGNNVIRMIKSNSPLIVGTLVGNGPSNSNMIGSGNILNAPRGVAVDTSGCIYISDTGNHRICKIQSGGQLITIAGTSSMYSPITYYYGYLDGTGTDASFHSPTGIIVDVYGSIYVTDTGNSVIRKITSDRIVTTLAGNGTPCFKQGNGNLAGFNMPTGITIDLDGILYIADTGNNLIRRITSDGNVLPIVGDALQSNGSSDGYGEIGPANMTVPYSKRASFFGPTSITIDKDKTLYVTDSSNNSIRKILPTFSNPIHIRPISIRDIKIFKSHSLGPILNRISPDPNIFTSGKRRGYK